MTRAETLGGFCVAGTEGFRVPSRGDGDLKSSPMGLTSMVTTESERAKVIEDLAREVGPLALGIAQQMLGERAAAQDAVQDAFLQAYRGLAKYRGDASLRTWFLRILINACTKHRRFLRKWVFGAVDGKDTLEDRQIHLDAQGDPGLRARLDKALLNLSHRQRTAFVLRYSQDMSIDEIASIMGCAQGTVKATIHAAVMKLRSELNDLHSDEDHGRSET